MWFMIEQGMLNKMLSTGTAVLRLSPALLTNKQLALYAWFRCLIAQLSLLGFGSELYHAVVEGNECIMRSGFKEVEV